MSSSFDGDIQRGEDLVARASMTAPNNPWAHHVKAQILRARLQYEEAILEYETVIALDRNFADAYAYLAWCKLVTGSMDEVIALEERAIRLSPRDPMIATWYYDLGVLHLLQSRIGEAIAWLEKARNAQPGYSFVHRWLAAAYGLRGDSTRAAEELTENRRLSRISSSIARLNAEPSQRWLLGPKIRPLAEATYFAGLRKAGMPEE